MSIISEEKMAAYLPAFELHKALLNEQQGLNLKITYRHLAL